MRRHGVTEATNIGNERYSQKAWCRTCVIPVFSAAAAVACDPGIAFGGGSWRGA